MSVLQNGSVRLALGLFDATILLVVAFVFLDAGIVRWAVVGMALVSAVVVPWVLGKAAEGESTV